MFDVVVIGAGPAGVNAALRAADLGARTALLTSGAFGGMAANDGPVPVRTLAHAARLLREARRLASYGIDVAEPKLDYERLLVRVREVVGAVRTQSAWRSDLDRLGVAIYEQSGKVRFVDPHTVESPTSERFQADTLVICTGGSSRRLSVPGFDLTATHSDAWGLKAIPPSMIVVGAGATGVQVASIFNAFGCKIQLFQASDRILPTEDPEISAAVADAFRERGILIKESFGTIERFERTANGIRMVFAKEGERESAEASLAVMAIGWVVDAQQLNLDAAAVQLDARGYVAVDRYLRTSVPHVFAAGDVTGRLMLVPQAVQDGYLAATNAVLGATMPLGDQVSPIGSFTDPEYAQVGLTETAARKSHDIVIGRVSFDSTTRSIIDGLTAGFCKLIADRTTAKILGCHVVGERAVEIAQVVAVAMSAGMSANELAKIPLSFPTYAGIVARAAYRAAREAGKLGTYPDEYTS